LDWLRVVPCDDLDVLYLFSEYANRLGNRRRNAGECSVLAWAEYHGAIAFVDDQVACEVGRSRGVEVRRTLGLVIKAARHGDLDEARAQEIVRNLVDANARLPSQAASDLFGWARVQNPPLI
jgi:predicted nucleic acid-binding protein